MPVLLEGVVRFPAVYAPWYVYKATLVGSPAAFAVGDVLFPSGGEWDRLVTDDAVLVTGYAFALEKFEAGMTEVAVAVPGSAVPFVAAVDIEPTSLVAFAFAATLQTVDVCSAAQLAAGKCIGRLRNHHEDHQTLRATEANDIVIILTGCV